MVAMHVVKDALGTWRQCGVTAPMRVSMPLGRVMVVGHR